MDTSDNQAPVVLVVDDESLLRLHAADLLEEAGYRVLEASDAESALKVMEAQQDVRLLFTDIQMPGTCNGVELARQVHERWPNVLLLITSSGPRLSGADMPDDGRFVAKPYGERELLDEVNHLIGAEDRPHRA